MGRRAELRRKYLLNRVDVLEAAIRRLTAINLHIPAEIDGDRYCFYCRALLDEELHRSGCAYLEAKRMLGDDG